MKHIKKVSPQPAKIAASPKPGTDSGMSAGPRTGGGCIPVGD